MSLELTLPQRKIVQSLVVITLILCGVSLSLQLYQASNDNDSEALGSLVRLFDVDNEVSIPTWFNAGLLLASAALLYVIAGIRTTLREKDSPYWWALSLIFLYLSIDEKANIHELAIPVFQRLLDASGWFYLAWVIPAIPILILFGVIFWRFWRGLPPGTRLLVAISGILYVGGALVMEMAGAGLTTEGTSARLAVITTEETLEMLGASLFIYTLLNYLSVEAYTVVLKSQSFNAKSVSSARAQPLSERK